MNNKEYLISFEEKVIVAGLQKNILGKEGMVTLKPCKLFNTPFGKFVGGSLETSIPMAVDYYGFIKKSTGMMEVLDKYKGIEVKSILVPTVYFASVKNEHITELAPDLLDNFPLVKKYLIELRQFKNSKTL